MHLQTLAFVIILGFVFNANGARLSLSASPGLSVRVTPYSIARDLGYTFRAILGKRQTSTIPVSHRHCRALPTTNILTGGSINPATNSSTTSVKSNDYASISLSSKLSSSALSSTRSRTRTADPTNSPQPTSTADTTSDWNLRRTHAGQTFFDGWDFFSFDDPTHGVVDYLTREESRQNGLIDINDRGNAIMRVETTQRVSGNRKSVRIHDKEIFNGGLLILDAVHMPVACGAWPAFWSNGPDWPNNGEIDILEGVHDYTINQASVHTRSGCRIPNEQESTGILTAAGPNCASYETDNLGCGIRSTNDNSYGEPFNSNGGGVYAMLWDSTGISVYFFPRRSIPADIERNAPRPEEWGDPSARWPATMCEPYEYFKDHFAIFDTTLCGDWAGSSESWNTADAGQTQSCAAKTGYSTCEQYVRENGSAFRDAYWEVKSVKLYSKRS